MTDCETCSGTGTVWRYVDDENGTKYDHPPRLTESPCPDCRQLVEVTIESFPMESPKGKPN